MTVKTISRVRWNLKHGKSGTFRLVKPDEEILASDIVVSDCCYDWVADANVGQKPVVTDTLIRLEFV